MQLTDMTDANLKRSLLDAEAVLGRGSVEARILRRELERRFKGEHSMPQTDSADLATACRVISAAALLSARVNENFLLKEYGAKVLERAHPRRDMSLKGLIEAACLLEERRSPITGEEDYLTAGFSTVSLPGILGDIAKKAMLEAYSDVPAVVPIFFGARTVTNFREYTEYRVTGDETFESVGPGGEIPHGTLGEEHEHYQVETHGKMFTITRTMVIDDDLGAFLQIPRRFGRGAALTREKAGAKLIMNNTGNFFHADHKNLSTGIGSALGPAGLAVAEKLMLEQTDDAAGTNPVMIAPKLMLAPPALKGTADDLFILNVITANVTNKYRGLYAPSCWPYLGNAAFHASASDAYWYLFADPTKTAAFLVAYLNGVDVPTIERVAAGPNVLGTVWRAYFDFGVSQGDHRAAVRSNGA